MTNSNNNETKKKLRTHRNVGVFLIFFAGMIMLRTLIKCDFVLANSNDYISNVGLLIVIASGFYGVWSAQSKLKV